MPENQDNNDSPVKAVKLCEKTTCTGCGSCVSICPHGAVSLARDENGFSYPIISNSLCTACETCRKGCPVITPPQFDSLPIPESFACWNNNLSVRSTSSSGGAFSLFAEKIIECGGAVYGASYDNSFNVVIDRAVKSEETAPFRGSKYVQADSKSFFTRIISDLKQGLPVLFSGTPCQNAALRSFLTAKHWDIPSDDGIPKNLFFVDFLCHGVASPSLWQSFLKSVETKHRRKLTDIRFRDKEIGGWKSPAMRFKFRTGKDLLVPWSTVFLKLENSYVVSYHKNLTLRECCHRCPWTGTPRMGDLTIADARSLYHHPKFISQAKWGISLLLVNTKHGKILFDESASSMTSLVRPFKESGLPGKPAHPHSLREAFLSDSSQMSYKQLVKKYYAVLAPKIRMGTIFNSFTRTCLGPKFALKIRETLFAVVSHCRKLPQ